MSNNTQQPENLGEVIMHLLQEMNALRAVSIRTETRLCKLIEHQGADRALFKPTDSRKADRHDNTDI